MPLVRTNITLPEELLRQIDQVAGPRGRSAYLAEAAAQKVKRDLQRRAFEETAGVMAGRPGHMDPDEILRFVGEARAGDRDADAEDDAGPARRRRP